MRHVSNKREDHHLASPRILSYPAPLSFIHLADAFIQRYTTEKKQD